jgi:hypothetical protein
MVAGHNCGRYSIAVHSCGLGFNRQNHEILSRRCIAVSFKNNSAHLIQHGGSGREIRKAPIFGKAEFLKAESRNRKAEGGN